MSPLVKGIRTIKNILKRGGVLQFWRNAGVQQTSMGGLVASVSCKIDSDRQTLNKEKRRKPHDRERKTTGLLKFMLILFIARVERVALLLCVLYCVQ